MAMKRQQLEHLIRAVAAITNQYEIVVIGSQSILGALPDAPDFLLRSMEADMYPLHRPDLADLIEEERFFSARGKRFHSSKVSKKFQNARIPDQLLQSA